MMSGKDLEGSSSGLVSSIRLGRLRKTMKTSYKNSGSMGLDFNPRSSRIRSKSVNHDVR
jgi:hypothetical protein